MKIPIASLSKDLSCILIVSSEESDPSSRTIGDDGGGGSKQLSSLGGRLGLGGSSGMIRLDEEARLRS